MNIFDSTDVYQIQSQATPDEMVQEDNRGFIQKVNRQGQKVNLIFTKAGYMRGGDLHKNTQYNFVFSGKVEVWFRRNGVDEKEVYEQNTLIEIPPEVPHLFHFLENTFLAEWWDSDFEAWYYRPYREIIENKVKDK